LPVSLELLPVSLSLSKAIILTIIAAQPAINI